MGKNRFNHNIKRLKYTDNTHLYRTTFEIKLIDGQLPAAGFYTVAVSASPKAPHNADKRFFLVTKSVEVKVTTQASISDLQIGVADRDQSAPKLTK
jgi:hypothetical protein